MSPGISLSHWTFPYTELPLVHLSYSFTFLVIGWMNQLVQTFSYCSECWYEPEVICNFFRLVCTIQLFTLSTLLGFAEIPSEDSTYPSKTMMCERSDTYFILSLGLILPII